MKRTRYPLIPAAGGAVLLAVLGFAVKYLTDTPFRRQIPDWTHATASTPAQKQIASLSRRASLLTTAGNLGTLGMAYYAGAGYEKAAACYRLAIQKDKSGWRWNYYLGYLNLEQGDATGAIRNFSQVLVKDPANPMAIYHCGEAYQEAGITDSAEIMYNRIAGAANLESQEKNPDRENEFSLKIYAMFQLARIYINSGRPGAAEKTLLAIISDQLSFGPAYRALGSVYGLRGDTSLSARYTVRANDLADFTPVPDYRLDKIALLSRSEAYLLKQVEDAMRSGNTRWALKVCDHAMDYFPAGKYFLSHALFGNFRAGNGKLAITYADRHLRAFAGDAGELRDAIDVLYDNGYPEEALKYFYQLRKLLPLNADLASWLFEKGKKQEAVEMMNDLVRKKPADRQILTAVIRLSLNLGDEEAAQGYLVRLGRLAQSKAETMKIKALMAEKQGRTAEATALCDTACQLDPADLAVARQLIGLYISQQNWTSAASLFNRALQRSPNDPLLLEGMGRLLIACPDPAVRNIDQGLEYAERAFVSYRSSYATRLSAGKNLATAWIFKGNKKKAVRFINETVSLAGKSGKEQEYVDYFRGLVSGK